ncbi:DUF4127 family protein [Paenibacillus allorhizosphaerae]|uniref:DUF4127 family protein n=1 Tax=Paenibacillus allorhizosphaerae TaxID=2849866 RepID=A0ABM8VSZ5_9BACL|nr:DUF4127 family protein [Paenibacillus allorhizosphaerae]CAG7657197.1 hypothetical protein PAECIP111802_06652 [Paenibacillus allorhizosphaerae]
MGKKIVYVPLDERPCNYAFPALLAEGTDIRLVRPGPELMGLKKRPALVDRLWQWLLQEASDADGVILSLDLLLYGGIIPSRLHTHSAEACVERLKGLTRLKARNPRLTVYAFQLIMRCPRYSSSDEEPDYYEHWGKEIFRTGYIRHKLDAGVATEEERAELAEIGKKLPQPVLDDYLRRRAVNREVNRQALSYVQDGTIDFMIVPQDDSAPYGWTAIDQQLVRSRIQELNVELHAYMYPGADEAGCTLLARMVNRAHRRMPTVYPRFSSLQGPFVTPLYEDRLLYESLKYHILAAGGMLAECAADADLVLLVNTPGQTMAEAEAQAAPNAGYHVLRNIIELTEYAHYAVHVLGKPCAVADVAYANGADLQLIKLLRQKELLFRLAGYAGWNTSSNTLGTVLAQGMICLIFGHTAKHNDFLALRYTEDAGYCACVRKKVTEGAVRELGLSYFGVDGTKGQVAAIVAMELGRFTKDHVDDGRHRVVIEDCWMPWSRMFEVGLTVRLETLPSSPPGRPALGAR